ncbi:hypothetical protein GGR50DRAFT_693274 [Xylaria sp. CBS 124048]|nr:hypothetical protein GGR50DRAFT_693274 [Xylaria sp. CBS 124048]
MNGDYSDLEILCAGKVYRVHRSVICPRSDFFTAACRGGFKEAYEGKICLEDDDPRAVDLMIRYFYHLDYDALVTKTPKPLELAESAGTWKAEVDSELLMHAKVYALADKYLIGGLKILALGKFETAARNNWHSKQFMDVLEEAYTSTVESDRGLKDAVVKIFSEHLDLLDKEKVQEILKNVGTLAYDLLMYLRRKGAVLSMSHAVSRKPGREVPRGFGWASDV